MDRGSTKLKIALAWNGLPIYGAIVVSIARSYYSYDFPVIRTLPKVPVKGVEDILSNNLFTVIPNRRITWHQLGLDVPSVFIHTGWRYKHFISLADEVRRCGGAVIGMFDNNLKGGARQLLGIIFFRLLLKSKFNDAFVPGEEGVKLAKYLGFDNENIYQGLYCANGTVFKNTTRITERKKTFIFVGQFIQRKGVVELLEAFKKFKEVNQEWSIRFIGEGDLKKDIDSNIDVMVEPFMQSKYIAKAMNESRILILPSYVEHWGVVVHEAALCGCGLLLTSKVGSAIDLTASENAIVIKRPSVDLIVDAMHKFANMSDMEFINMEKKSLELSKNFNSKYWLKTFRTIIGKYEP